jgi:hypothetical protein
MQNSNDIASISISDIISSTDVGTTVSIREADIVVNVFHLIQYQKEIAQLADSLKGSNNVDNVGKEQEEVPQAKLIYLPSKDLHGVWESYVIVFLPRSMS